MRVETQRNSRVCKGSIPSIRPLRSRAVVARQPHKLKVVGSNPTPASILYNYFFTKHIVYLQLRLKGHILKSLCHELSPIHQLEKTMFTSSNGEQVSYTLVLV